MSDNWTWGELLGAIEGHQERQQQEHRALAILLYRYGMAFTPGKWEGEPPTVMDIFPLWSEEEREKMEAEIQLAQLRAKMERWAAAKITKGDPQNEK